MTEQNKKIIDDFFASINNNGSFDKEALLRVRNEIIKESSEPMGPLDTVHYSDDYIRELQRRLRSSEKSSIVPSSK